MRHAVALHAIASGLLLVSGPAEARQYRWCALYPIDRVYVTECGFDTRQQCMDTIFGLGGFCRENPRYIEVPPRNRKSRRS